MKTLNEQIVKSLDTELESSVELPKLKSMKLGSHEFLVNSKLGYYPYFSVELRKRVRNMKANNIVGTGEGGIGKSYMLSDICRTLSPYFGIEDVVYRYPEFLRCVQTARKGTPIEFDEPSYAMSKKDWYMEVTKALVKTIESFRFKGKPLFIPIINKQLLEKDIRSYLMQYHVHIYDRGKARVYRLYAAQDRDKVYRYELCQLRYKMFDINLCSKKSCLSGINGCPKLFPSDTSKRCMVFRAQYERKKISTQEERYEKAIEDAEIKETSKLDLDEIEAKIMVYFDKFYIVDKDKIDTDLLAIILKRMLNIRIGHNKLYRLKRMIEYDHPDYFQTPPIPIEKD